MLETTLCLLAWLLMITAGLDLGQFLMSMQYLAERSRAGARWAAVNTYDADAIRNIVVYNSPTAPPGGGAGFMQLSPANVTVTRHDQGGPGDRIEVNISNYPLRLYTPLLAGAFTARPFRAVIPVESLGVAQ